DRDADGREDLFDRPYRGAIADGWVGTEDGPDLRIDADSSTAAAVFLDTLSDALFPDYPDGHAGIRARVVRIDVFGAPFVSVGGSSVRSGLATLKVTARIVARDGSTLSESAVRVVVHEIPYSTPPGVLHSCADLTYDSDLLAYWGVVTATGSIRLHADAARTPPGPPRAVPPGPKVDLHHFHDDDPGFALWKSNADGTTVADPWLRVIAGGPLVSPTGGASGNQPWPSDDPTREIENHSNLFQGIGAAGCPALDYDFWKYIATSGARGVRYFAWDGGDRFRENGLGDPGSIHEITDDREGIFFFDTADGAAPRDTDGDGLPDNLTPAATSGSGPWGYRGVLYLNAEAFRTTASGGHRTVFRAPAEPFQDANENGRFDGGEPWIDVDANGRYDPGEPFDDLDGDAVFDPGENWINLSYPSDPLAGFPVDLADTTLDDGSLGLFPVRNARGPEIDATAGIHGILFTAGRVESAGDAIHFGSVIAAGGIRYMSGRDAFFRNPAISRDWPPAGWALPRVVATRWEADP
ncbi:MAG: hypothetical protein R3344_08240, partial [Acidobacteriota bacterium]|nr:hypothetical protein [Acidobacteriota bacterium]